MQNKGKGGDGQLSEEQWDEKFKDEVEKNPNKRWKEIYKKMKEEYGPMKKKKGE